VTVNRALDVAAQGIRVDMAAFSDGPAPLWKGMELWRHWRPGMILWVSTRTLTMRRDVTNEKGEIERQEAPGPPLCALWDQELFASVGFRFMPYGVIADADNPKTMRHAFTTLTAFRGILRYRPKRIRILCMDLSGSWVEGRTEEECDAMDREKKGLARWRHERVSMDKAIADARAEGIEVEEVIPSPVGTV
jgi:hypothetical protein